MKALLPTLVVMMLSSCSSRQQSATTIRPVKSTIAQRANYIERDFAGMSTPDEEVNLAFKVSGQILDIPVSDGDLVRKGQLLAQLDPRDFELQVTADRSSFEQAESQLNRIKRLLDRDAVSKQEWESAKTAYDKARSIYENSRDLLQQTELRAPFEAVVEATYANPFERVASGARVVRIVLPLTTTVKFTIPESSLSTLEDSTTMFSVEFDNYRGVDFVAHLDSYAITTSEASGFPVSLTIDNPSPLTYKISPGFSCRVTMSSVDKNQGAISLPLSAIYAPTASGEYVWIITDKDRVEQRAVTLGELYGSNRVIVNSGVGIGERVVTAGVYQLKENEEVKILSE